MIKESIGKHSISITMTTIAILILFIITSTFTISEWKADTEQRLTLLEKGIEQHTNAYNNQQDRILNLESENNEVKIRLATIDAKLANIETLLIDIKDKLE